MKNEKALRAELRESLDWGRAHASFDRVVKGVPPRLRGKVPKGFAHSIWQVLEHMRIAQEDILDFCRNPRYQEKRWPDDYWPKTPGPKTPRAWTKSFADLRRDRRAMQRLAADRRVDLFARIPHGSGQTYIREVLLVADHAAYHVAQIVDVRRALEIWKI